MLHGNLLYHIKAFKTDTRKFIKIWYVICQLCRPKGPVLNYAIGNESHSV